MAFTISNEFHRSYQDFAAYPRNLMDRSSASSHPRAVLQSYAARLTEREDDLCLSHRLPRQGRIRLQLIDISEDGVARHYALGSDDGLKTHLGHHRVPDPRNPEGFVEHFKVDPRARFVLLPCNNTLSPLQLTADMLRRVLSFHQVMPSYIDFLSVYGIRPSKVRFSGFRTEIVAQNPGAGLEMPALGRSGLQYQLCYNIGAVAVPPPPTPPPAPGQSPRQWSIQQAAIYHQFDLRSGNQVWFVGDPHRTLSKLIEENYPANINHRVEFKAFAAAFRATLNMHLIYVSLGTLEWRNIIQQLEETLGDKSSVIQEFVEDPLIDQLETKDLSDVQEEERKATEVLVALEGNESSTLALSNFYEVQSRKFLDNSDMTRKEALFCSESVEWFISSLKDLIQETRMQIKDAKHLIEDFSNTKTLLLQRLDNKKSAKTDTLNNTMKQLALKTEHEAIMMRIITTFFSAGVIKSDSPASNNSQSSTNSSQQADPVPATHALTITVIAMRNLWLEWALPLTVGTFILVIFWYKHEKRFIKL
ncbi:hypothetical protein F5Y19DRAFT_493704 [Xylariaceae sp. FL1651]|nr:hypothetical protein F5Y19DRAFT_493704 [Xylariaceae sp. FL1651]